MTVPHPVRASLAEGRHDDTVFDRLYAGRIREVSEHFWTPLAVACRVSAWLTHLGASRVLDVGSGPGKFCIAAGVVSPTLTFTGVEQRPDLVSAAKASAELLGLDNVAFVHARATETNWSAFDAFYFFNTFGENLHVLDADRFDNSVELSVDRWLAEVAWTEHRLATLPLGSVVATYHGFGGAIPACFDLLAEEPCGTNRLRVWLKTEPWRMGCWYELHDGGVRRGRLFTFGASG